MGNIYWGENRDSVLPIVASHEMHPHLRVRETERIMELTSSRISTDRLRSLELPVCSLSQSAFVSPCAFIDLQPTSRLHSHWLYISSHFCTCQGFI